MDDFLSNIDKLVKRREEDFNHAMTITVFKTKWKHLMQILHMLSSYREILSPLTSGKDYSIDCQLRYDNISELYSKVYEAVNDILKNE